MNNLIYSNCFIETIKLKLKNPKGHIGYDFNSPSGKISFYFDLENNRYRFRRKIRKSGNRSVILFYGYRVVEQLK